MNALSCMYVQNDQDLENIFENVDHLPQENPESKSEKVTRDRYKHYAIFEASQKFRGHRMPVYLSDRDPKYNKKRDKFIPEPLLLDRIVRGNWISDYDSFESLIDNPYINYIPIEANPIHEKEMRVFNQSSTRLNQNDESTNRPIIFIDQSLIMSAQEQGWDFPQDNHGDQRISSLMEPLLERDDEEEEKSKVVKSINNRVSTWTSYSVASNSQNSFSEDTVTLNPEDFLNNGLSPTTKDINHWLIKELK